MNKKSSAKELEEAIINHKPLIEYLGDDIKVKLTWDSEILNYRGYIEEMDLVIGIWTIEGLIKAITEDWQVQLSVE